MIKDIKNRTKDELPLNTVHRIRSILYKMDVFITEVWFDSAIDGCYSLRVNLGETILGQSGKGVTSEFSLASGYAELMERLANDLIYSGDFSKEARQYLGFYFAPDEKYLNAEDLLVEKNSWIDKIVQSIVDNNSIQKSEPSSLKKPDECNTGNNKKIEALKNLSFLLPEGFDKGDFICLPFYNLRRKNIEYVPHSVLKTFFGSNGACAGNTIHEAIVHGVSEILERYVNNKIIEKNIVPPMIPDEYLKNFELLYGIIKKIEAAGPFKVIVKDCSLNGKYPVVCVILINKQFQTYQVKFGAHPIFEMALEHSLTELLQCVDVHTASTAQPFHFGKSNLESIINFWDDSEIEIGSYPSRFFSDNYDYEFKGIESLTASNVELSKHLLSLLLADGHDVLIRDNSFLGFPSCQIIVPGLSELCSYEALNINQKKMREKVRKIIRNLHRANNEELRLLAGFINSKYCGYNKNNIMDLFGLPVKNILFGGDSSLQLLLVFIQYKIGNYSEACHKINSILKNGIIKDEKSNSPDIVLLKCIKDYIAMEVDNKASAAIKAVLSKFYSENIVTKAFELLTDKDKIFEKIYKKTSCFDCLNCEMKGDCTYKDVEPIYMKVKEIQKNNVIDQLSNMKLLNDSVEAKS